MPSHCKRSLLTYNLHIYVATRAFKLFEPFSETTSLSCDFIDYNFAITFRDFLMSFTPIVGRYSDWLRAGRSGDRIPVGGEIFRTCPDRPWGTPSILYNGYQVFPGGKERPGRDADPSPPSSASGHERVELYLYPLYGAYGLYRASVSVQG